MTSRCFLFAKDDFRENLLRNARSDIIDNNNNI